MKKRSPARPDGQRPVRVLSLKANEGWVLVKKWSAPGAKYTYTGQQTIADKIHDVWLFKVPRSEGSLIAQEVDRGIAELRRPVALSDHEYAGVVAKAIAKALKPEGLDTYARDDHLWWIVFLNDKTTKAETGTVRVYDNLTTSIAARYQRDTIRDITEAVTAAAKRQL